MNYPVIIGVDPAGIGSSGIIIYDTKLNIIIFHATFKSKSVTESKAFFLELLTTFKKQFLFALVIVENFFIRGKITNPLATPELIGCLRVIIEDICNWKFEKSEPIHKIGIVNYKRFKLTIHEQDAYKHVKYFLRNYKDELY